jgi:tetratricopeptide (TPR) repeat protein
MAESECWWLVKKDGKKILGYKINNEQLLDCNMDIEEREGGKFISAQKDCPDGPISPIAKHNIDKILFVSYALMEKGKFGTSQKLLDKVLQIEPGNPLALNNLAAIMVAEKKFDKADAYLKRALLNANGYMVQVNRVCAVGNICFAFKTVTDGTGNQELEPLIKMNIEMVKGYATAGPTPGKGLK